MNNTEYALIVAGGKGTRMKSTTAKQFLELQGQPVLMHTIAAFLRYNEQIRIILVLAQDDMATWKSLCQQHNFSIPLTLQAGGASRFQSVKNGLGSISGDGLVAIHDGVRPLVNSRLIRDSFRIARQSGTAIAGVPLKETIRRIDSKDNSYHLDRSDYRIIQTPQTFRISLIKEAYQQPEDPSLTDDASVAEKAGFPISLYEGSYDNIKITTAEDLAVVNAMIPLIQDRDQQA